MSAFMAWLRAGLKWPRRNVTQRNERQATNVPYKQEGLHFIPGDTVTVKDGAMPRKKWITGKVQHVQLRAGDYLYQVQGVYYSLSRLERVQQ